MPGPLKDLYFNFDRIEYYPNFHYFVNDKGEVGNVAKINRGGKNEIAKIFTLVVAKMGKPADEVSDQEVYEFLIGKKVKIQTETGTYMGKTWFRNNIAGFED